MDHRPASVIATSYSNVIKVQTRSAAKIKSKPLINITNYSNANPAPTQKQKSNKVVKKELYVVHTER